MFSLKLTQTAGFNASLDSVRGFFIFSALITLCGGVRKGVNLPSAANIKTSNVIFFFDLM